jgi:ferritin-like metal-binding protein YciE
MAAGGTYLPHHCEVIVARDKNEAINSYIGDMLALEQHIEKALKGQLTDLKDYPDVVTELREIHRQVEHHISDLRALSDRRNAGGVAESVKRAGSAVAGAAAGLIDLVRSEGLPKNLRDDYTAFNLANIGYLMLHTTALALGDQDVAELGRQHFRDYAEAILRFDTLVPVSVIRYLQQEGLPAKDVVSQVNRTVKEAWDQAEEAPAADTFTGSQR